MQLLRVNERWNLYNIISISLKFIMAIGAMLCFFKGHYLLSSATVGIIIVASLPVILSNRFKLNIPPEFECMAIIFVYATLYLGSVQGYYARYWWWDSVLHAGSGFILGILGFLLVYILNERREIGLAICFYFFTGAWRTVGNLRIFG